MMGPYWWYGAGWGWMAMGWVMMVVLWALAVVGVVALVRAMDARRTTGESTRADAPIEILRRRYAAGELTKEQFEQMKRDVA